MIEKKYDRPDGSAKAVPDKPVGERPGSPSYFGRTGAFSKRGMAEREQPTPIGERPGSPSYYGLTAVPAKPGKPERKHPKPIGQPPGSPSYYGLAAASDSGAPSRPGTLAARREEKP